MLKQRSTRILARVADSYRLKDLNSTNGTQINVPPDARQSLQAQAPRAKETRPFQACSTETTEQSSRKAAEWIAQLSRGGVEVIGRPESPENGKFAWILDPEGNKVELWEPMIWNEKNKRV